MVMMPVVMIMSMLMAVRLLLPMTMGMPVPRGIGACFRIKRCTNGVDVTAQPPHHVGNHMIVADENTLFLDHGRQMPVAQMPRHTQQMQRVVTSHFQQVFLLRFNPHDTAVFQQQSFASAEQAGMLQIEQHPLARTQIEHHTTAMAAFVIGGKDIALTRTVPASRWQDFRTSHVRTGSNAGP